MAVALAGWYAAGAQDLSGVGDRIRARANAVELADWQLSRASKLTYKLWSDLPPNDNYYFVCTATVTPSKVTLKYDGVYKGQKVTYTDGAALTQAQYDAFCKQLTGLQVSKWYDPQPVLEEKASELFTVWEGESELFRAQRYADLHTLRGGDGVKEAFMTLLPTASQACFAEPEAFLHSR